MATRRLCVLGSTGSIGTQTLSLADSLGIEITSLSGCANTALLAEQCERFRPEYVCTADERCFSDLRARVAHLPVKVLAGAGALCELAADDAADTVLTAVVGVAGLLPTAAAIKAGKTIALANKETLVAGGRLITSLAKEHSVRLLPVDSEHSAIFQCLQDVHSAKTLCGIILTASGGPFFGKTAGELERVTVADALRHPNWSMGKKITVDSATLMNKGLELIEAMWLFGLEPDAIEIAVHRQSILHSAVRFADGSVIAQLGEPDMRLPIQYALTYPDRKPCPVKPLSVERMSGMTFERPDAETFECLAACTDAARRGGVAPCVANAANEVAVAAFLQGSCGFMDIGRTVSALESAAPDREAESIDELLALDAETRVRAAELLAKPDRRG